MGRVSAGLTLIKQAIVLLKQDKRLLAFPVMSALSCLLLLLITSALVVMQLIIPLQTNGHAPDATHYAALIGLFVFYFMSYFIIVFFNTALASSIMDYCQGGEPSVYNGLVVAWNKLEVIAGWVFISSTIGVLLHLAQDRSKWLGQLVEGLLGGVWRVVTFFVIPVLVTEDVGPLQAVKRSFSIIKQAWGESLVCSVGAGFLIFLGFLVALGPVSLGWWLHTPWSIGIGVGLSVLLLMLLLLVNATLMMILRCVLYLYAAQGRVSKAFDSSSLEQAFRRAGL